MQINMLLPSGTRLREQELLWTYHSDWWVVSVLSSEFPYTSHSLQPEAALDAVFWGWRSLTHWMGEDKGRCYVETTLVQGADIAHTSLGQVKTAAEEVLQKCSSGGRLQGGIAYNIGKPCTKNRGKVFWSIIYWHRPGGDDNLAVIVGAYNRPVQCRGHFPAWESCRELLRDVPATKLKEYFGVDVPLPYVMPSCKLTCCATPWFGTVSWCSSLNSRQSLPVAHFLDYWTGYVQRVWPLASYDGNIRGLCQSCEEW